MTPRRALTSFIWAPPSWPHRTLISFPKVSLLIPSHLGVEFQHEFRGDANIQFITKAFWWLWQGSTSAQQLSWAQDCIDGHRCGVVTSYPENLQLTIPKGSHLSSRFSRVPCCHFWRSQVSLARVGTSMHRLTVQMLRQSRCTGCFKLGFSPLWSQSKWN